MTLKEAKTLLRNYRLTITRKDGEFRVNLSNGREGTAYYTNDLDDAVMTALAMVGALHPSRVVN